MRRKILYSALIAAVLSSLLWAVPATADDPQYVVIDGEETAVPLDCARTGTGDDPDAPSAARWSNVPLDYEHPDTGDATPVDECANLIFELMVDIAYNELDLNDGVVKSLRDQLFTGNPDFRDPYQVYLANIIITVPALAALDDTPPNSYSGLGSCEAPSELFVIQCRDDGNGRITLRDEWGNVLRWPDGEPVYLYLSGWLSQGGGTTYGNAFLLNEGSNSSLAGNGGMVEHHEQTHSQQWAQYGWEFADKYLSELAGDPGDAIWHWLTTGQVVNQWCFNYWERRANLTWGGYTLPPISCNPSWTL
jgi:hypothetical protein